MDTSLALHPLADEFLPDVLDWWRECEEIRRWFDVWTPRERFRGIGTVLVGSSMPCLFSQEWVALNPGTRTPVAYLHGEIWPLKDLPGISGDVIGGPEWRPHMDIQIAVQCRYRGQRIGPRAVEAFIGRMPNLGQYYWMHIDCDNESSQTMAARAGFERICTTGGMHHYRRGPRQ